MSAVDDRARLHEEIEQTREALGETVEALAAKTDVKARASRKASEVKERAVATGREAGEAAWAKLPPAAREKLLALKAKADERREQKAPPVAVRTRDEGIVARARANPGKAAMAGAIGASLVLLVRRMRRGRR